MRKVATTRHRRLDWLTAALGLTRGAPEVRPSGARTCARLTPAAAAAAATACPAVASAAQVLVLSPHGRVAVRNDPTLRLSRWMAQPAAAGRAARAGSPAHVAHRNVRTELGRLRRINEISKTQYWQYVNSFNSALRAVKRLAGTRATELGAVIENLHAIAAER